VAEAAPLSDGQLIQLGIDEVPDGQSQRWLLLHMRKAMLMAAGILTRYAQRKRNATAGAWARALEAAGRAIVEA
jgi:hypothetical protein